jgi:hypothetical protein
MRVDFTFILGVHAEERTVPGGDCARRSAVILVSNDSVCSSLAATETRLHSPCSVWLSVGVRVSDVLIDKTLAMPVEIRVFLWVHIKIIVSIPLEIEGNICFQTGKVGKVVRLTERLTFQPLITLFLNHHLFK